MVIRAARHNNNDGARLPILLDPTSPWELSAGLLLAEAAAAPPSASVAAASPSGTGGRAGA
eukprot:14609150-Alexandrium_andersonii.AAC.1